MLLRPTREQSPLRLESSSAGYRPFRRGLEKLGIRASSNARNRADGLSEAVESVLPNWTDRFRQGASSVSDQSAAFGKDALQRLIKFQMKPIGAHLLLLQWLWKLAFLSGWQCPVAVNA
jgi:hypothetical protein